MRGFGRGTAATIVARGIDVVATYAFYAVLARSLTVADFGRLIVGMTVLQIAATVSRFGLDQALLTVAPSGAAHRFGAGIVATVSAGLVVAVLIGFPLAGQPLPAYGMWLAFALPVVVLGQYVIAAMRARGQVATAAVAEGVAQPVASFAFAALAAAFAPAPASFVVALLLSWVVAAAFAVRVQWTGPRIEKHEAAHLLRTGRSMLGVALLHQTSSSADVVLLGLAASVVEVAQYGAAQKIAAAFILLHGAITTAAAPFMRSLADDRRLLAKYHRMATHWTIVAALPLFIATMGVPAAVLRFFGTDYAPASVPLLLLSVGALALVLSGPAGSVLLCTGHSRTLLNVGAAGAVTLVVSVALLARFGAVGAAAGVLIGRLVARGLVLAELRRVTGEPPFDRALLQIVFGAAAGVLVTRLAAAWLGDIAAAALGCTIALAVALSVLTREGDVAFLRSELRRS